jgi:hypothetical protein
VSVESFRQPQGQAAASQRPLEDAHQVLVRDKAEVALSGKTHANALAEHQFES